MIIEYKGKKPKIDESCFTAHSADIIGDVIIEEGGSVWFGAVLRGDTNSIHIGKNSNIQDNCVVHANGDGTPIIVEENVTVGHGVILHGCHIGRNCIIGMGAIILDGANIGENTIIGAGALVPGNKEIPSGVLCLGSPAKIVRELSEEEIANIKTTSDHYVEEAAEYK